MMMLMLLSLLLFCANENKNTTEIYIFEQHKITTAAPTANKIYYKTLKKKKTKKSVSQK
ncbi:hypothetical protein DOY81_003905 [Sarcophaga bullata]|nr:hypothetical protein DOY81_003905 [Sarcophaga bullata]